VSGVREASVDEVAGWDAATVDAPGGHVLQSRAWAEHRRATGWRPWFLVLPDGAFVLALTRSWSLLPGGSAYVPRGPVPDIDDVGRLAARLDAVAGHLASVGIDVVASDAEVAADGGYPEAIRRLRFRPIEEIQPSRHRMAIALGRDVDDAAVHAAIAKQTRARIRSAEAAGIVVRRYDAGAVGRPGLPAGIVDRPIDDARAALDAFFDLETRTAKRRGFSLGPRRLFLDWWEAALRAGHLVYLEALAPEEPSGPVGGLVLYRHGRRLSAVQSSDRVDARRRYPGVLHLLRWRAIQQAIVEGCDEMDLGGTDVPGARRPPRPGEPMYGLYEHKASFGARWVDQAGAHEKVFRPRRYAAGRLVARLARAARRAT
jgi:lipid II:glycine glycyltransferase (peptidoglycan interpeptide bridge formation enzyme)